MNGKKIDLTTDNISIQSNNFNVDENGNMTCNNANMQNASIDGGNILVKDKGNFIQSNLKVTSDNSNSSIYSNGIMIANTNRENVQCTVTEMLFDNIPASKAAVYGINYMNIANSNNSTDIDANGITTPVLTQTSLESKKKNIEKFENALEIIKNVDIYKYNLKSENDTDKKHIGFVIGDNYNYSKELTSNKNDGADIYSLASCCLQGIKEQQKTIEKQEKIINELTERIKRLEEK